MKLLHINPAHPFSSLYHRMLKAFDKSDVHQVYVPLAVGRRLPNEDRDQGLSNEIVYSRDYRQFDRLFYHRKRRKVMSGLLRQMQVDRFGLIHGHFLFSAGGVAHTLRKIYGIPYVVSVQNTDVNTFFKFGIHLRAFALKIMEEAEKIIFINPPYRDLVLERYVPANKRAKIKGKCCVIPYGIDPFWLDQTNATKRIPAQDKVCLLFVGAFTNNKNVRCVIEVARELQRQGHEVNLDLVGDGVQLSKIEKLAATLPNIHLHGHVHSHHHLRELYRRAGLTPVSWTAYT